MREKIIEILNSIKKNVDFENAEAIIDDGLLESFDIIRLTTRLADEFDVEFTATELVPENFNTVDAITEMIEELAE